MAIALGKAAIDRMIVPPLRMNVRAARALRERSTTRCCSPTRPNWDGGTDLRREGGRAWCAASSRRHLIRVGADMVARGDVALIIDGGENIAVLSLWFANEFPDCQVLAVEPDDGNHDVLCRNVAGTRNIRAYHAAFVERSEHAVYESRVDRVGLPGTEQREGRRPVGTVMVQRLPAEDCRYRPLIVKLDIEGAETGLLSSTTEWL